MIPLYCENFDGCSQSPSLTDKSTQTCAITNISNSSHTLPNRPKAKTIKGCEINEDLNTTSKHTLINSCEVIKPSLSERYNSCTEIFGPYVQQFTSDHNSYVETKERRVDTATDSYNAQPCKIIYIGDEEKTMSPVCHNDRSKSKSREEPEASCSVSAECPDEPLESDTCCCCNNEPPCVKRPKCPPRISECERKPNICDKTMKETNECQLKRCITKCVRDTVKTIKRDQRHCETVIGYIPSKNPSDKTVFYPFNRVKERGEIDCPPKKSSVQHSLEASRDSLSNMKDNVGSFICKVYNKTREIVGLAASDSCRHLGLTKQETHAQDSQSESNEPCCRRSKKAKKKCSATKCLFENTEDSKTEVTDNVIENVSVVSLGDTVGANTEFLQPATEIFEKICSTMKTSFPSLGSGFTYENLADVVKFPKPDRSSKYDVPTSPPTPPQVAIMPPATPPKKFSEETLTPVPVGIVKSVTNKICSIFRYGKKGSASSLTVEKLSGHEIKEEEALKEKLRDHLNAKLDDQDDEYESDLN